MGPIDLDPLRWSEPLECGGNGRIQAERFVDNGVEMVQIGDLVVQELAGGISHVWSELLAQLVDLVRMPHEFVDNARQCTCRGVTK